MTIAWQYLPAPGVDCERRARDMQPTRPASALILIAIARGHHTIATIAAATKTNRHTVSQQVADLQSSGDIVKQVPVAMDLDAVPWAEGARPAGVKDAASRRAHGSDR